jgi:DNA-binding beta-propeller fold protein YncE
MARRGNFKRLARREVAILSLAGLVLLLAAAAALAVTGDLTQPAGSAGCVSEGGSQGCAVGHSLTAPTSVAVSPDGKSVYVASYVDNAVARLTRDTTTGAITQPAGSAGCVSNGGSGGCAVGHALSGPASVAVSPDGKSVYVASYGSNAVVRLTRNTTSGAITQPAGSAGCVSNGGSGGCAIGHGLIQALLVGVSPDGTSVYVASYGSNAVARLTRDTTSGAITQPAGSAGCISKGGSGGCAVGNALSGPNGVAVSADGTSVYVASYGSNAVARLTRNTTSGAITQPAGSAGCISEKGSGGCATGHGLSGPNAVAVSADGTSVYVASYLSDAVARLNRNTTSGAITQPTGSAGCISETGSGQCANGNALFSPLSVAVSADGKSVYDASYDSDAAARFNRAH